MHWDRLGFEKSSRIQRVMDMNNCAISISPWICLGYVCVMPAHVSAVHMRAVIEYIAYHSSARKFIQCAGRMQSSSP